MLVAFPALLAALLAGMSEEEDRKSRMVRLGLGEPDDQEPLPFRTEFSDLFVPVWTWPDGTSVWKMVLFTGFRWLEQAGIKVRSLVYDEDTREAHDDLDPAQYLPGGAFPEAIAADIDVYAWVRGGNILSAFSLHGDTFRIANQGRLTEKDKYRIDQLISTIEPDFPFDPWEELDLESFAVEDELDRVVREVDQAWERGGGQEEAERIVDQYQGPGRSWLQDHQRCRVAWENLVAASLSLHDLLNASAEEWFQEQVEQGLYEAEQAQNEQFVNQAWQDAVQFESDEIRPLIENLDRAAMHEAVGLETGGVAQGLDTRIQDKSDGGWEVEVRNKWASRYDEPIDTVELSFDEDDGLPALGLNNRYSRSATSPGTYHLLKDAGILKTRSEIAAEEPDWKFPGPLQGEWEAYALMGLYQPTGGEPVPLFCKIAADHGLLSAQTLHKWGPVMDRLPDSIEILRRLRLIQE